MKTTKWSPDTCDCVIEYEWDETLPAEERTHTQKSIEPCEHHAHMDDVLVENRGKNQAMAVMEENGVEATWTFDENRKLVIDVADKARVQELKGKVAERVANIEIK